MKQNYNNFLFKFYTISKYAIKNEHLIIKVKKGQIHLLSNIPFKYNYKTLAWYYLLLFHQKPAMITTKLKKNFDDEKTTLTGLRLSFSEKKFSEILTKLINIVIPQAETIFIGRGGITKHSAIVNYHYCMSHHEIELFEQKRNLKYISKFNFILNIVFNYPFKNQIKFFFDFFNLPVIYQK